jgi:hypothetical protein
MTATTSKILLSIAIGAHPSGGHIMMRRDLDGAESTIDCGTQRQ